MNKTSNPIEQMASNLGKRFPESRIRLDPPENPNGSWFLDITHQGHFLVVEWRPDEGFGITCSETIGFGTGADEVYADMEAAYSRVLSLLLEKTYTSPPVSNRIHELRQARGLTQEALAALLSVRQAGISKLERRNDVLVSTVRDVVRSMGGELTITARFPDGMQRTLVFDEPRPPAKKQERKAATPRQPRKSRKASS